MSTFPVNYGVLMLCSRIRSLNLPKNNMYIVYWITPLRILRKKISTKRKSYILVLLTLKDIKEYNNEYTNELDAHLLCLH